MEAAGPLVVVMGVSGCGKSTVGELIAAGLGAEFLEGDSLHPPQNIERMAAGIALTDADRAGWLQAIGEQMASRAAQGRTMLALQEPVHQLPRNQRQLMHFLEQ